MEELLGAALEAAARTAAARRKSGEIPPFLSPRARRVWERLQAVQATRFPAEPAIARPASPAEPKERRQERAPAPSPPEPLHEVGERAGPPLLRDLFGTGKDLVRAVVAAEVLGPPLGLRER